jgi:hypothetical protein
LSPFLYAVFIDGLLDSVHSECAGSGPLAGASRLVLKAYADDKVAASSSPLGLQRILHAMKRYGDTWGCCANTDKSHVLLVGPPEAVALSGKSSNWPQVTTVKDEPAADVE